MLCSKISSKKTWLASGFESGPSHTNNFGSDRIRIHSPALN
jgi:hypothetical protein